MSQAEWPVCEPLLPAPAWPTGRGGRPARWCMRDIVDAIRYLTHSGPVWRALPADLPPVWTVYWWADKWQADGSTARLHDDLRERIRPPAGRSKQPSAAVIDSPSVKGSEIIARPRRGYDAGKKINGTKRHIAVVVIGLLLTVLVSAHSVQDRDAAKPLLWNLRKAFPSIKLTWADRGYAGKLVTWATSALKLTVQIVKRADDLHTFKVLPRRWVVERTLAWITRHRRTVREVRAPDRPPRDLHLLGPDHHHDPPPRPCHLGSQVGSESELATLSSPWPRCAARSAKKYAPMVKTSIPARSCIEYVTFISSLMRRDGSRFSSAVSIM